jgi:hypothetical protein
MSQTVESRVTEGDFAPHLGEVQGRYDDVLIGSYPWFKNNEYGTNIILRSRNKSTLADATGEVRGLLKELTKTLKTLKMLKKNRKKKNDS